VAVVGNYWIRWYAFGLTASWGRVTSYTFDPGTDIYARVGLTALSYQENAPYGIAEAAIDSWNIYGPDGSITFGGSIPPGDAQPSIFIANCANVTMSLYVFRADARAEMTLFTY
jgi:hypothetical protein